MERNTENENISAYDLSHFLRIQKVSVWSGSPGPRDYGDPSSRLWSLHFNEALQHDKALVEGWRQFMSYISLVVRIILLYILRIRAKH
jgi:hypothetical protein